MGGLLREGKREVKLRFIDAEKASFPINLLCRELGVSRSGYYAHLNRAESNREREDQRLRLLIHIVHREGRRHYGRPKVHAALKHLGEQVSPKRVARLMREEGLRGKLRRRFARTTNSDHAEAVFPNLLERDFTATAPNQRWVADITYLRTPTGFIYLAVVLDLFSRAIVGWALGPTLERSLVIRALENALVSRCPGPGLLHHSDRGCQYASKDYQSMLSTNGITCSMSGSGNCLDNAAMESWFSTLKLELREDFKDQTEAQRELFDYIEVFYNRKRLHSAIGYVSPSQLERTASQARAA
jgi:transposase InsO family protein